MDFDICCGFLRMGWEVIYQNLLLIATSFVFCEWIQKSFAWHGMDDQSLQLSSSLSFPFVWKFMWRSENGSSEELLPIKKVKNGPSIPKAGLCWKHGPWEWSDPSIWSWFHAIKSCYAMGLLGVILLRKALKPRGHSSHTRPPCGTRLGFVPEELY